MPESGQPHLDLMPDQRIHSHIGLWEDLLVLATHEYCTDPPSSPSSPLIENTLPTWSSCYAPNSPEVSTAKTKQP